MTIAVGAEDGAVSVWRARDPPAFDVCLLSPPIQHTSAVRDVAWAPHMGRRYHIVASCSSGAMGQAVRIHTLHPGPDGRAFTTHEAVVDMGGVDEKSPEEVLFSSLDVNASGSMLAVIATDQRVRVLVRDDAVDSFVQRWTLVTDEVR